MIELRPEISANKHALASAMECVSAHATAGESPHESAVYRWVPTRFLTWTGFDRYPRLQPNVVEELSLAGDVADTGTPVLNQRISACTDVKKLFDVEFPAGEPKTQPLRAVTVRVLEVIASCFEISASIGLKDEFIILDYANRSTVCTSEHSRYLNWFERVFGGNEGQNRFARQYHQIATCVELIGAPAHHEVARRYGLLKPRFRSKTLFVSSSPNNVGTRQISLGFETMMVLTEKKNVVWVMAAGIRKRCAAVIVMNRYKTADNAPKSRLSPHILLDLIGNMPREAVAIFARHDVPP